MGRCCCCCSSLFCFLWWWAPRRRTPCLETKDLWRKIAIDTMGSWHRQREGAPQQRQGRKKVLIRGQQRSGFLVVRGRSRGVACEWLGNDFLRSVTIPPSMRKIRFIRLNIVFTFIPRWTVKFQEFQRKTSLWIKQNMARHSPSDAHHHHAVVWEDPCEEIRVFIAEKSTFTDSPRIICVHSFVHIHNGPSMRYFLLLYLETPPLLPPSELWFDSILHVDWHPWSRHKQEHPDNIDTDQPTQHFTKRIIATTWHTICCLHASMDTIHWLSQWSSRVAILNTRVFIPDQHPYAWLPSLDMWRRCSSCWSMVPTKNIMTGKAWLHCPGPPSLDIGRYWSSWWSMVLT